MRVVLIEDHTEIAALQKRILNDAGHDVIHIEVVDENVVFVPEFWDEVEVAVIDLMLSGSKTNGIQIASWIAEHKPRVRRVICSALPHVLHDIPASLAITIAKPFDPGKFVAVVEGHSDDTVA